MASDDCSNEIAAGVVAFSRPGNFVACSYMRVEHEEEVDEGRASRCGFPRGSLRGGGNLSSRPNGSAPNGGGFVRMRVVLPRRLAVSIVDCTRLADI